MLPPSHRGRGLLQPVSAPLDSVTGSEVLVQLTPEVQKQVQGQEAPFSLLNIGQKRPSRLKGVQDVTVPLGNESFQVGVRLEEGIDGSLGKITLELMSKSQPHPRITRWGAGRSARWAEGSGVQSAASFAESQPSLFLKARGRPWEPGVRSPLPLPLPLGKPRAQFEPQFLHPRRGQPPQAASRKGVRLSENLDGDSGDAWWRGAGLGLSAGPESPSL